jgi:hypothetical protein
MWIPLSGLALVAYAFWWRWVWGTLEQYEDEPWKRGLVTTVYSLIGGLLVLWLLFVSVGRLVL